MLHFRLVLSSRPWTFAAFVTQIEKNTRGNLKLEEAATTPSDPPNRRIFVLRVLILFDAASTLQAMLVNSADLMGGSSEPDGFRGFGRVHLEGGLPLGAEGDLSLFVADAFETEIEDHTIHEYRFEILPNTGLELRASLSWLDPPVLAEASQQMLNDLDLTLVAPDGRTFYRMWSDGADVKNVIERVIISSSVATAGTWTVAVSCLDLTTDTQPYSLVVTGPIDVDSGGFSQREATGAAMDRVAPSALALWVSVFAMVVGALAVVLP